jgi:hypothetical protein
MMNLAYCRDWLIDIESTILQSHALFTNFNYFVLRAFPYTESGRYQNEKEAIEKDEDILKVMRDFNIPHLSVLGNYHSANGIVDTILDAVYKKEQTLIVGPK